MKFTLSWLKEHLDTTASLDEIATALTALGLEVEGIEDKAKLLAPFTVAYVRSAEQHPNADKLRVCMVETGTGVLQVVCGAPNARAGMKGVFAPSGSTIPGTGLVLKPTSIRGVESNGMLCSEREMGLSQEHDGIIELSQDAPVGAPFAEIMGLGDPVIEIKLTPNRGDCNAVAGIARDLAAAGLGRLKDLAVPSVPGAFASPIGVATADAKACPMFAGRLIRGVKNRPSPDWLQRRLRAIGLRPISALVDVTNYISYDRARPLHVYDAAKVAGTLTARFATAGETLEALDGRTYTLDEGMIVIADDRAVLGLGGVMGGEASGCTEETTDVFIESALFDPMTTARTGRVLGIHSDARYRFERGVDPAFVRGGLELATRMILEICGGEASEPVVAGAEPEWRRTIRFDTRSVGKLTGVTMGTGGAARILSQLGFGTEGDGEVLTVTPPSWRPDIHGVPDLVEEVVRVHGFGHIPSAPLARGDTVPKPVLTLAQKRARTAKRLLAARGFNEAVTYSFIARADAARFGGGDDARQVANPIAADLDAMRPSVLPGLLAAAARNQARAQGHVRLFEVGPQFTGGAPGEQQAVAAGIRIGHPPEHWAKLAQPEAAFAVKADVLALLGALDGPAGAPVSADAPGWYHPGQSGAIRLGRNAVAFFGALHPAVIEAYDLKGPAAAFEVILDAIPAPKAKPTKARGPLAASDFQPVERDFAFVLDAGTPAADVLKAAQGADRQLIESIAVFDLYEGEHVGAGKKSLAIRVRLQPRAATLTDLEIETVSAKIVAAVTKATGGTLRN